MRIVQEVIDKLKEIPPDTEVYIYDREYHGRSEIGSIELVETPNGRYCIINNHLDNTD